MPSAQLPSGENSVPPLRVIDLTKWYGEERAIDGVTFSASAGEVVGIIGPNGAGKTTLLETLVGLLPADAGDVLWHGEPQPASERRNALFYLPDGVRPYRDDATFQVVSFFAGVYRRSKAETADTVTSVGLRPVLHKRVHTLSKGYNRRLLLALALLAPHPMLLMDEHSTASIYGKRARSSACSATKPLTAGHSFSPFTSWSMQSGSVTA